MRSKPLAQLTERRGTKMTEEQAFELKEKIIGDVEYLVESSSYSLEDIVEDVNDRLCHLHT